MAHGSDYNNKALGKYQLNFNGIITKREMVKLSHGKNYIEEAVLHWEHKVRKADNPYIAVEQHFGQWMAKHNIIINYHVDNWKAYFDKKRRGAVFISGYFQYPQYAKNLKLQLRQEICLSEEDRLKHNILINKINTSNSVCVHIRRGDYEKVSLHQVCGLSYYQDAISLVCKKVEDPYFFIFTDDQNFVRKHMDIFEKYPIFYASETISKSNGSPCEELFLMSLCKHFIISNSSFSWWAQFLGTEPGKMVVAPNRWYNSAEIKGQLFDKEWEYITT